MTSRAGPDSGGGDGRGPPLPAPRGLAAAVDQQAVEQWLRFALAQEERIAPHPDPASLPTCSSRAAYRLALRHLDGLPLFASQGGCRGVEQERKVSADHLQDGRHGYLSIECPLPTPLFPPADRCFDVRLGVSLWDAAAGCFFGNTAHSAPVSYDMRRSKGCVNGVGGAGLVTEGQHCPAAVATQLHSHWVQQHS